MTKIQEIIAKEAQAIAHIPDLTHLYELAVSRIHQQVFLENKKIITSGVGKAGQIALNIATTFCSIGIPAVYLHPGEAQHGDLGVIQRGDVLLLVSNSGETREVIELLELLLHSPYAPRVVITITGNLTSSIARQSSIVLPTGNPPEVCIEGLVPTTSTTVMTVIGDILVVLLQQEIRFTKEDYALLHHGGYLGKKAKL